jgi:glycosyltransferase involved in cell wall biosynthesis
MSTRPRLALFVNQSGNFLTHRTHVAQAARAAGYDVHLVTRLTHDRELIERHGVTVHHLEFPRRLRNPLVEWRAIRNLTRIYRQISPDLIHHFSAKGILLGSLAARRCGVQRVVNTFTGLGLAFSGAGKRAWLKRTVAQRALRKALQPSDWQVTFQNPEDMQQLISAGVVREDRSHLIRSSGVDPDEFCVHPVPAGTAQVMLASRLLWPKGVGEFVEAARVLQERGTDAKFVLVGASDSRNPTSVPSKLLRQWEEEKVVQCWGHCGNMPYVLAQATIVVLPSYYGEGVPKVLLEAASCGRPIVTTDVRGCREAVGHEHNGLLVPPRDSKSLADAIARLLDEPWERRQMGARGRKKVEEQFSVDMIADQILALYDQMLGRTALPLRRAA